MRRYATSAYRRQAQLPLDLFLARPAQRLDIGERRASTPIGAEGIGSQDQLGAADIRGENDPPRR